MSMREEGSETEVGDANVKGVLVQPPSEKTSAQKSKEVPPKTSAPSMKPYKPHVPYPQRLVKAKDEQKYG